MSFNMLVILTKALPTFKDKNILSVEILKNTPIFKKCVQLSHNKKCDIPIIFVAKSWTYIP